MQWCVSDDLHCGESLGAGHEYVALAPLLMAIVKKANAKVSFIRWLTLELSGRCRDVPSLHQADSQRSA